MSTPNFSKEPDSGSTQPVNPYQSAPQHDAPQGLPYQGGQQPPSYQGGQYQSAPYAGQGGQGFPYAAPPATNSMALGSLIASIAGLTLVPFIGCVVGVILGHIARKQLAVSNEQGAGLALAGLITGYVGLALYLIAVLGFFLLFAVFAEQSRSW